MRSGTVSLCAVVVLCFLAVPCVAGGTYWQGSSGLWTAGGNWTNGVPVADDSAYINNSGTATVDAAATTSFLYLGEDSGDSGTVRIQAGGALSLVVDSEYGMSLMKVGASGTGELIQTGGSLTGRSVTAGERGTGSVTHTGGTATLYGLTLGLLEGSTGTYDLSGTAALSAHGVTVGFRGKSTFTHTAGTNTIGWDLILGGDPEGEGRYELSGTGELLGGTYLFVGNEGTGTFVQTGGTVAMTSPANWIAVGYKAGSEGDYELSGTGEVSSYGMIVGNCGTGAFTQTGGAVTLTDELQIGNGSNSHGTYDMTGGQLDVARSMILGPKGTFTLDGGTVRADDIDTSAGGTFRFHGGRLELPSLAIGPAGPLGADLFLGPDQALQVPSPVAVETGGALILSGGSYECDRTQLNGGVLTATRGMTLTAGQQITGEGTIYGAVDLADATIAGSGAGLALYGDLSGTGTVSDCTIYGEVSVGHSAGRMTMENVVFGSGTGLHMEIGGLGPDDCDEIVFLGEAALSGRLEVLLIEGFSPARGDRFDLFDWTSSSGAFEPIDLPVLPGDLLWNTSDLYVTGELAVVPEPASAALVLVGLAGLCRAGRKKPTA